MIISDEKNFVFIHIPKCGGTEIKSSLKKYDSYAGLYDGRIDVLGIEKVDFTHLPLQDIKKNFPELFNKILDFESYTIVRDPIKRFSSGINQYVKFQYGRGIHDFSSKEIKKIIDSIILKLEHKENRLDPSLIYFEPQVSFIYVDGAKVINNIFSIHQMGNLKKVIQDNHDIFFESIGSRPKNSSLEYRAHFIRFVARFIPTNLRELIRKIFPFWLMDLIRKLVFKKASSLPTNSIQTIENFVNDFYKDDISLYQEVINNE